MKRIGTLTVASVLLAVFIVGNAMAGHDIGLFVNEKKVTTDVAPQIVDDRVMIPIRSVAEALGAQVSWDDLERNVHIQKEGRASESDDSTQRRVELLETWIQPKSAQEAVENWAKATQYRNGAVQFAMLSSSLKELLLERYEEVQWVPGVSSPWLAEYTITPIESEGEKRVYEVSFEAATSTGPAGTGKARATVEKLNDTWQISQLEDAGGASLLPGVIIPAASESQDTVSRYADQLLDALANKDMETMKALVHPERGVRFSPYSYVDVERHVVFTREDIGRFFSDETEYEWGTYDGKGDPIVLTPADFYDHFIFDLDYRNADEVSYNEQLFQGNTLNNAAEVYPDAIIVEHHFYGSEEQYAGMDWRSLRFVFEPYGDEWRWVGVIHDEWTI